MAIRGNVGLAPISVIAGDTIILEPVSGDIERVAVSGFSLHNTFAGNITVTVYESPDLTSASGISVAKYVLAQDESVDVNECIGQGYVRNIIAVASGVGVNAKVSYTEYTSGD
jgi:hypothetical protein